MTKITLTLAAVLLTGCATQTAVMDPEQKATTAIAAAEQARQRAAAVGYEWRDTGKFIDEAKAALAKKDYDTALALATKAERQGKAAVAQQAEQQIAVKQFMQ